MNLQRILANIQSEQYNQCTQPYSEEKYDNYSWDPNVENTDSNVAEKPDTISDEELGELLDGMDWENSKKPRKTNSELSKFSKTRLRFKGRFI